LAVLSRILVVNAGSTSLKLSLVDEDDSSTRVSTIEQAPPDVVAIVHRVVHGGTRFHEPTLIDDTVTAELDALRELAPLHNGPALAAIEQARRALPDVPHVAVFDTAFHRTMPEDAFTNLVSK
jgi:acetate kinase